VFVLGSAVLLATPKALFGARSWNFFTTKFYEVSQVYRLVLGM